MCTTRPDSLHTPSTGTSDGRACLSLFPLQPVAPVPATTQHAKGISMDEVFEQRWRKAYEVRALERESRQGQSQVKAWASRRQLPDAASQPDGGRETPVAFMLNYFPPCKCAG
jgi:hypothetical protein